jgi:hypothetical protein
MIVDAQAGIVHHVFVRRVVMRPSGEGRATIGNHNKVLASSCKVLASSCKVLASSCKVLASSTFELKLCLKIDISS